MLIDCLAVLLMAVSGLGYGFEQLLVLILIASSLVWQITTVASYVCKC